MGAGGVTMTANTTATVSNNNLTVGSVSGSFALTKQGAGTLTIDGGAFYTGNTTVNQGTLALVTLRHAEQPDGYRGHQCHAGCPRLRD
jgi:autotransporter-associated beta strand protein